MRGKFHIVKRFRKSSISPKLLYIFSEILYLIKLLIRRLLYNKCIYWKLLNYMIMAKKKYWDLFDVDPRIKFVCFMAGWLRMRAFQALMDLFNFQLSYLWITLQTLIQVVWSFGLWRGCCCCCCCKKLSSYSLSFLKRYRTQQWKKSSNGIVTKRCWCCVDVFCDDDDCCVFLKFNFLFLFSTFSIFSIFSIFNFLFSIFKKPSIFEV